MFWLIAGIVLLVIGMFALTRPSMTFSLRGAAQSVPMRQVGIIAIAFGLYLLGSTSFVHVGADGVGHLKRVYGFSDLPKDRIVALGGEKGPQARILGPGFHIIPFVRVLYDYEEFPVVKIDEGHYGQITALDGQPMPGGMFMAPAIADEKLADMLDPENFLTKGGYRGAQETVLKPGNYRVNRYLFHVITNNDTVATVIPAGSVGVVKSNTSQPGKFCKEELVKASAAQGEGDALSVPLVPVGCFGLWRDPLLPGAYYLNLNAFQITMVDTRLQTWEFKGGYTKRMVDLKLDQQGNIQQTERQEVQPVPKTAADRAVFVKIEGWDIPLELRVLVQVRPQDAPVVVGSVGGVKEIEDRVLTPVIRSIVRNVAGSTITLPVVGADGKSKIETRPTRVLDLIENRSAIEQTIETLIKIEGRKAGLDIREIRLGEPAIPPELLLARLREQLADQLTNAYKQETLAQQERIKTESARSTANDQPRLVEAQIAVQMAEQREKERAALGRAERQYLEELARGQSAQAAVLGQDRVTMLQALDKILQTLERKPELVGLVGKLVPNTVVGGDGGGLAGAAALFGAQMGPKGAKEN